MAMNKSKGNMYPWITHTWNPIRGICKHDCAYCYIKLGGPMGWKHPAKLIEKEVDGIKATDLGKGNFIFVGSSTDMWGKWVPDFHIRAVLKRCDYFNGNKYLFQTKDPKRFHDFTLFLPEKSWLCTTIETNRAEITRAISKAPDPKARAEAMQILRELKYKTTLTIEPVMDFDLPEMLELIEMVGPEWISIGADSKKADLPEPPVEKIRELVDTLHSKKIETKIKKNFKRLLFDKKGGK